MDRKRLGISLQWNEVGSSKVVDCELIGRVVSKARVGYVTVKSSVLAAWKVEGELQVKTIGFNLYSFVFPSPGEAKRVLKENPWVVRNYMLSLQRRKPFLSDHEIQITTCEFWIQFHNLPPEGRMLSNIMIMAERVGRVIEVEDPRERRNAQRGFGRARVEIEIDSPLVPGFFAPRPNNMDDVWIQVKYEKLARFCFNCGRMGHESRTCDVEDQTGSEVAEGNRGYDATLCTQPFRVAGGPVARKELGIAEGRGGLHGGEGSINCPYGEVHVGGGKLVRGESSKGSYQGTIEREGPEVRGIGNNASLALVGAQESFGQQKRNFDLNEKGWQGNGEVGRKGRSLGQKDWAFSNRFLRRRYEGAGSGSGLAVRQELKFKGKEVKEPENDLGGPSDLRLSGGIGGQEELGKIVGVLGSCLREIKLKRGAEDEWEAPSAKRSNYLDWDPPISSGKRGVAEAELDCIAGADDSKLIGVFKFEGTVAFSVGSCSGSSNGKGKGKKIPRRTLFIEELQESEQNKSIGFGGRREGGGLDEEKESDAEGLGGCPETATKES